MSKPVYTRLGDIVNFKRGYDLPHHARQEGPYPVISSGGISGYHAAYKASGEGLVTGRYGTLGEAHHVTGNYWPHNTALYVTDFKGNYPKYVYFLMKCLGNLQTADKSTVPGINRNDLHEVKVPYHKPSEQKAIADLLWVIDDKIALNTRINAELEAMAKLLYDYWFVQFDFPNAKGKPYKSSGGAMVHNAELKREVPEGWEVTELRKYIGSNRGHSYTGADIGGEGLPMINLNSFNTNSTYKVEGLKMYSGVPNSAKILEPFDLVMCNTQQTALDPAKDIIGKSLLVPDIFDKEIVSSHHVTTINVKKDDLRYYLNSLFNSDYFHRYISGYCSGTNILGLNFEGVLSFRTAIPNNDLLKSFGAMVQSIEQRKSISLKETQELTTLRDWLLPMLMNGQVVVGEAEEKVGLAMAAEGQAVYKKRPVK